MTNHFTQEEAVTLAESLSFFDGEEIRHEDVHALCNEAVDAKLAKAVAIWQARDKGFGSWGEIDPEHADGMRKLGHEVRVLYTHPQVSEPAPSTAGEHSSAIEMAIAALKDLGSHGAYSASIAEPAIVALQSTAQPVGELTDEQIGKAWSVAEGEHNASASVKRRITRAILAAAHKIGGQG